MGPEVEAKLFGPELKMYALAESFSSAESGKLRPLVEGDANLMEALSVVLEDGELDMNMRVGFTGRPNVGCLVMNGYLRKHLRSHPQASAFVQALDESARRAEHGEQEPPCVMVAGSVFGGTGASLLPVAKASFRAVFSETDANKQPRINRFNLIRWGKLMLLPYFRPKPGEIAGVNPARHFVDTAGALWYYGLAKEQEDPTYLLGSESPDRRKVELEGGDDQLNPTFHHELVAALACLDFYAQPKVAGGQPVRHFSETTQAGTKPEDNSLFALPLPHGMETDHVRRQLAYLFHVAAFAVDWRRNAACEFHKGLLQYAREARLTGWAPVVHEPLVAGRENLPKKGGECQAVVEYFARLLLWGRTVLASPEFGASGLAFNADPGQYASLHNTLCQLSREQILVGDKETVPQAPDNLIARLCRLGLAGLALEEASQAQNHRGHSLALDRNTLFVDGHTVRVGLPGMAGLATALQEHNFPAPEVAAWYGDYKVAVKAA